MARVHDSTPVLVGVGRFTLQRKKRPAELATYGMSPLEMLLKSARLAIEDAGLEPGGIVLDSITHLSSATDASVVSAATGVKQQDLGEERLLYPNAPAAVATALNCPVGDVRELVMTGDSGSWPQVMVNRAFEKIARGELRSAMVLGAEALESFRSAVKQGVDAKELRKRWSEAELQEPGARQRLASLKASPGYSMYPSAKDFNASNRFFTENWRKHGLGAPSATYPLFEDALRLETGRTLEEQNAKASRIFSGLSKVAAAQKNHAWFGTEYTPEELSTPTADNRPICFPYYNKRMNSVMDVDMSAAVLMMSAGEARARGVPPEKWVFLHGCGEAMDSIDVLERPSFAGSPALRIAGRRCLSMAGVQDPSRDLQHLDIYSCFPSAVQIACKELGIPDDDGRPLSVTGGLPYHGGPGSNYVTHSIAAMVEKLRSSGPSPCRGLVTANGGYLTKHALGVYANFPDEAAIMGSWSREAPAVVQALVDAEPRERVVEQPNGSGVVEHFSIRLGNRGDAQLGVIVGRLTEGPDAGARFVANLPDNATSKRFVDGADGIGTKGVVTCGKGKATFRVDPAPKL